MENKRYVETLPRLLKVYEGRDYMTRQRAKFIFYLSISLLISILFLIVNRMISHPLSNVSDTTHLSVLLPMVVLFLMISACFILLLKGFYSASAYLLPVLVMAITWLIMFSEDADALVRLDTVANIFAALSMVPLLIGKKKYTLLLFPAVNIMILFVFVAYYKQESGLSDAVLRDYLLDVSVTMAFLGVVGYNIFNINKNALDRAENDLRERKAAEQALRASEKKFREMTMLLPQTVYEADSKGMLTFINKAGTDMFGYTEEDIRHGLNILSTIAEEDHERVMGNINRIAQGVNTRGNQYTCIRKNGSTFPVQIYSSAIIEDSKPVGIRGVIFDDTVRMKAEEELRQSHELFRTLVESNPNLVVLMGMDQRLIMVNHAFSVNSGIPKEGAIGKTLTGIGIKILRESDEVLFERMMKDGSIDNIEAIIAGNNREERNIILFARMVEVNNNKAILVSSIDITERKLLEDQLKEYNQKLEFLVKERTEELSLAMEEAKTANTELKTANAELFSQREQLETTLNKLKETQEQLIHTEKMASLGILTAGVAHEINNPINYIYNGALAIESYVNENFPDHSRKLSPLFEAINTWISRTKGIVASLNKYSRKEDAALSRCHVHEILENCLTMLYDQYKKRIEVVRKFDANMPFIMAGEAKLHQALLNVLINAVQSIPEAGMITIATAVREDFIEIRITDTGQGITKENLKHIFDPFFTTKDPGQGTGLGLSITQSIIREHHGSIKCSSQPGAGSEFIINLPINK